MARRKDKDEGAKTEGAGFVVPELDKSEFARNSRPDSEPIKADVKPRRVSVPRKLYWFGALPAVGSFDFKVNAGDEIKPEIIKTTAYDLWNSPDLNERRWVGKCPIFQNIPVGSETFVAFSDMVTRQTGGQLAFNPYPGMVKPMTDKQVQQLIKNCTERFVIRLNGAERRLVDLEMGQIPKGQEKHPNLAELMANAPPQEEYNEYTDTFVAEYVYLRSLPNADPFMPQDRYYTLLPHMDEVLMNPPEPLATLTSAEA